MPADMIFGYVMFAAVFGVVSGAIVGFDKPGSTAKQFLIGALWPISVPVAALCALFLGARAVVHSFGEWRGSRDALATAVAIPDELASARKQREREVRRLAREVYLSKFMISIRMSWPGGVLATLWACIAMFMPIGWLVLLCWVSDRFRRSPAPETDDREAS